MGMVANPAMFLPFTESSGSTVHDVSGNGNHGTITSTSGEAVMWAGRQTESPYFARLGGVQWSDGTNTVYVPQLSNGSAPASTNVTDMTIVRTNLANFAHNAGPYSLIFGGATNTYANLLTNDVNIVTNAAGLITELYEVNP